MKNEEYLNKLHKDLYDLLIEFDNFCKENDLKYSLTSGTLIGAIREKGFIPWDDDIDIMMDRENYEKFIELGINKLNKDENSHLKIDEYQIDQNYNLFFAKFINTNILLENDNSDEIKPLLYKGIWLDIFPFDYISSNKFKKFFLNFYVRLITSGFASKMKRWGGINTIKKLMFIIFPKNFLIKKYNKLIEKGIKLHNKNKDVSRCCFTFFKKNRANLFYYDKDILKEFIYVKFEKNEFPVIKDYDIFLRKIFGNYMVPPKKKEQISKHISEE